MLMCSYKLVRSPKVYKCLSFLTMFHDVQTDIMFRRLRCDELTARIVHKNSTLAFLPLPSCPIREFQSLTKYRKSLMWRYWLDFAGIIQPQQLFTLLSFTSSKLALCNSENLLHLRHHSFHVPPFNDHFLI